MIKRTLNTIVLLAAGMAPLLSQVSPRDSVVFAPLIAPSIGVCFPGGDMVRRFGINGAVGGSFMIKTRKNVLYGVKYDFLFGKDVKEHNILDNLKTSAGFIIDASGSPAEIDLFERGHAIFLVGGRVLPQLFPGFSLGLNKNSGLMVTGGVGFLQHKILITGTSPQLTDAYKKGYDRLSNGLALNEFIGYVNLSNNRLLNFYLGAEFMQAWTQNRRGYNFDQMAEDTQKRVDVLSGFKFGWILPLYKRVADEFYYN